MVFFEHDAAQNSSQRRGLPWSQGGMWLFLPFFTHSDGYQFLDVVALVGADDQAELRSYSHDLAATVTVFQVLVLFPNMKRKNSL